jgi:hypothetical protein
MTDLDLIWRKYASEIPELLTITKSTSPHRPTIPQSWLGITRRMGVRAATGPISMRRLSRDLA